MNGYDVRVDEYIDTLPGWQQDMCQKLRMLIHSVDMEIEETIKRTVLPYFILKGNICAFMATKDHINLFIYDPIADDPRQVINQGHGNHTARAVQVYKDQPIDEEGLRLLLRNVVANNRAGGWRKIGVQ